MRRVVRKTVTGGVMLAAGGVPGAASPPGPPIDPTVEGMMTPAGIDATAPRLGWKLVAARPDARNLKACAWQVLVASTLGDFARDEGGLWDSGRVESAETIWIPYTGRPPGSRRRCHWKVRVWGRSAPDVPSPWSVPSSWVMGVVRPEDWTAKRIGAHPATRV